MAFASQADETTGTGKMTITLLGKYQARKGHRFIYSGPIQGCKDCQIKNICFNLEKGRRYSVVNVRDKEHMCRISSTKVKVVEVEQVPFRLGVPRSMIVEGSVITYHPVGCGIYGCRNWLLTHPPSLEEGTRIKVIKIHGDAECEDGTDFLEALVDFV